MTWYLGSTAAQLGTQMRRSSPSHAQPGYDSKLANYGSMMQLWSTTEFSVPTSRAQEYRRKVEDAKFA